MAKSAEARRTGVSRRSASPHPVEACSCVAIHEEAVGTARAAAPAPEAVEALGELFRIFSDPTRIRMLAALAATELCVCDLGAVLGMSQSAVSHQLAMLRAARLVRSRRAGKVIYCFLDDAHVSRLLALGLEHVDEGRNFR